MTRYTSPPLYNALFKAAWNHSDPRHTYHRHSQGTAVYFNRESARNKGARSFVKVYEKTDLARLAPSGTPPIYRVEVTFKAKWFRRNGHAYRTLRNYTALDLLALLLKPARAAVKKALETLPVSTLQTVHQNLGLGSGPQRCKTQEKLQDRLADSIATHMGDYPRAAHYYRSYWDDYLASAQNSDPPAS